MAKPRQLHPLAGQGQSLGLRDATELVLALRRAQPAELPALLRGLEWVRGPAWVYTLNNPRARSRRTSSNTPAAAS